MQKLDEPTKTRTSTKKPASYCPLHNSSYCVAETEHKPLWSVLPAQRNLRGLALEMLNIKIWVDGPSVEITGTIPVEDADVVTKSS